MGLFAGDAAFRNSARVSCGRRLSRHDVVALYIAGCNINARVATKGDNGTIWIYRRRGASRARSIRVFVEEDFVERGTRDAKRKKAQRNG